MNKRLITALIIAFIAVKNPVNLIGVEKAFAASTKIIEKANAISEANIAENINSLYQKQNELTNTEKWNNQLVAYQKQLAEEIAKQKAIEEERMARENSEKTNKLVAAGLSTQFINSYVLASKKYGVPWEVIAAVHKIETHQSGNTVITSFAGAQGPMQFMPSTFNAFAQDGDSDGQKLISDVDDAIFTGANYLAANGAANGNVVGALYRYNHDYGYVYSVLGIAKTLGYSK